MPFTLSHAAAVLPGIRRDGTGRGPLIASALVAGSFAPDLTYFADSVIPGAMEFGEVTHAVWGALTVDVLITALALALWLLLRDPLVALLPPRRQGRVHAWLRGGGSGAGAATGAGLRAVGLRGAARFAVSAALGSATHVVWDAFTHQGRWGVRLVPGLDGSAAGLPVATLVQYGTSAPALLLLGWFAVSGLRRTGERPLPASVPDRRARRWAFAWIGLCVVLGTAHRCARWYAYFGHIDTPLDIIPTLCFGAGSGLAAGLLLYAAAVRLAPVRRNTGPRAGDGAEDGTETETGAAGAFGGPGRSGSVGR
ncbi:MULTISPECIES: DUF4184 family protein [unclassified Streptomyces]|uniref:DUF4184 family protein n=1 Tax=unclassified Streptomyces TaxID=2593676 RepID=UPI000DAF0D78|nr:MULTISPECIES: DUF4184 family protein [unclassified Streptomyces]PZT75337.1 DUF4184 domain-containing protein [Streptomyces sp. AC1-42T]PZT83891.1 DUF4184 domain-containing protein [Streptomyces sp. AC1-42W]